METIKFRRIKHTEIDIRIQYLTQHNGQTFLNNFEYFIFAFDIKQVTKKLQHFHIQKDTI